MNLGYQTPRASTSRELGWEWAGIGAVNTGMIERITSAAGAGCFRRPHDDFYHTDLAPVNGVEQLGVESRPRFEYRARLGWSDGTWSVTGFMDFAQHFYHTMAAPPNVNNGCITPGGTVGGLPDYSNPCFLSDYNNHMPSYYTFDLSLGYSTADRPANEYLRNISVQLVVQNITDKTSPYEYKITTGGGLLCVRRLPEPVRRMISMRLQKSSREHAWRALHGPASQWCRDAPAAENLAQS